MNFSPNNSGNKVKPGTRISLSSIPPPQNTQFDLIIRDLVKYFFTHPQGEVMVFIYKLQKLGHEEDLCLEEEPNNFLLQLMVNLALGIPSAIFCFQPAFRECQTPHLDPTSSLCRPPFSAQFYSAPVLPWSSCLVILSFVNRAP